MTEIHFLVSGQPVGQPRHRVTTRGGHSMMYLPCRHPVHAYKKAIKLRFGPKRRLAGPIEIVVNAWFPRPKSKVWKKRPMPSYRHASKPDADNVLKAVLDALNGLAWIDDAQVFSATIRKFVCSGDMEAHTEILIREAE